MSTSKLVTVENKSTVVNAKDFAAAIAAVQHQVSYHFKPYWNEGALLRAGVKQGSWHLAVVDDADQAGALGYHEMDASETPDGFVFAKTSEDDGVGWASVLSHETLELVADPWVSSCWQVDTATFVALEVCDPVEVIGYEVLGVTVSNFVLPKWFIAGGAAAKYDHLGHLTAPLEVEEGGYVSVWKNGKWTQFQQKGGQRVAADAPDRYVFRGRSRISLRAA